MRRFRKYFTIITSAGWTFLLEWPTDCRDGWCHHEDHISGNPDVIRGFCCHNNIVQNSKLSMVLINQIGILQKY